MDLDTLAKGALEVAKAAALSVPFSKIVGRMLGPAADEYAEHLQQRVRLYRLPNELKAWQKATKAISDAGFKPNPVPPKLLFPLLEGASLEENEDLHTMWAGLLANASNPETPDLVHPSYEGILRHLTPQDAAILRRFYDIALKEVQSIGTLPFQTILFGCALDFLPHCSIYSSQQEREEHFREVRSVSALASLGLVASLDQITSPQIRSHDRYMLTVIGYEFTKACQAPALRP